MHRPLVGESVDEQLMDYFTLRNHYLQYLMKNTIFYWIINALLHYGVLNLIVAHHLDK